MDMKKAFSGQYLGQVDLTTQDGTKRPVILEMTGVRRDMVGDTEEFILGLRDNRGQLEKCKPLILNKTNSDTICDIYGNDSTSWIGKDIEVYIDPNVMFGGKKTGGLRVRKVELSPPRDDGSPPFNDSLEGVGS